MPVQTSLAEVLAVLADLDAAGCRAWVGGGWGVDVLVGRQTRPHADLDLAVDAADEGRALEALGGRGYCVETDWRPVRVELVAPAGRVDLHPVVFDADRCGEQAGIDGVVFRYPADAFSAGRLGGVDVPCLSRVQQLRFRRGYELRDVDRHDLALLAQVAGSGEAGVHSRSAAAVLDDEPGQADDDENVLPEAAGRWRRRHA